MYGLAGFLVKRALAEGSGIIRFSFVSNWAILVCFSLPLILAPQMPDWSQLHWPVMAGAAFFVGQVFTFAAIRLGDVSVQTPIMGTKVLFVAMFMALFGWQAVDGRIWIAAIVTTLAIALLGLTRVSGGPTMRWTVLFSLISAASYALADTMIGRGAPAFGRTPFLFTMMTFNCLLSFGLIPFFRGGFGQIPRPAWPWIWAGAALLGVQSLILVYFMALTGKVAEANILYSSRGVWSVVLGFVLAGWLGLPAERPTGRRLLQRVAGAVLMTVAIWIVLSPHS